MKHRIVLALLASVALLVGALAAGSPGWAANAPTYHTPNGANAAAQGVVVVLPDGNFADVSHPQSFSCVAGCGSGSSDASAANQALQITQETAVNTVLGTVTASPTANTIGDRLKTIHTDLSTAATASNQTAPQANAGSDATKAVAVQGVTGGKAVSTSDVANVAQASTTSGQTGPLVQCATTTSAPTYTAAKTNPLSCDTAGSLRISAPATAPVNVTLNTPPNDLTTGPSACTSTSTCTALTVATGGAGSVGVQVTGSGAGMAWTFQGSIDGTNYFTIACYSPGNATAAAVSTGAANGAWYCPAAGYKYARLNWTGLTSGTVTETLNSSAGSAQPPSTTTVSGKNGSNQTTLAVDVNGDVVVVGAAADNATAAGNPVTVAAIATSAERTNATNGQNSGLVTDLAHKLITLPYANPENMVSGTTAAMTGTTSTSLIAAPASGLRNYITNITCVNSHATVGTLVTVQDGSGGTALYTLAAGSLFGGASVTFPVPLRQPTTATALYVADVTTGANVICSATGYKGAWNFSLSDLG